MINRNLVAKSVTLWSTLPWGITLHLKLIDAHQ
jgi:hypothetical protein